MTILGFLDVSRKCIGNYEKFKEQLHRIDGTVVNIPEDLSYVDVRIPEANYGLVRLVQHLSM